MELIPFEYTSELPVSFSKPFVDYLNTDVKGKLIVLKEGEIIIPILIRNKMKFKIGYFVHIPIKNGKRLLPLEEKEIMRSMISFFKKNKQIDFILPPLHLDNFNQIPLNGKGYRLGIISLQLANKTIDQIFESFKPVYRRHIRNAEKIGVEIKFGIEYFDDFYTIYSEKLKQEKAVHDSYETLKKLALNFDSSKNIQCGVAYLNGKIEAGILNVSDAKGAYYLFGGSSRDAHNGSFRLLHWELIKSYKASNLEFYKLGAYREGEMLTEKHARLASFKMGFGAEVEEGFHFTLLINPFKYWLYNRLIQMKNKIKA